MWSAFVDLRPMFIRQQTRLFHTKSIRGSHLIRFQLLFTFSCFLSGIGKADQTPSRTAYEPLSLTSRGFRTCRRPASGRSYPSVKSCGSAFPACAAVFMAFPADHQQVNRSCSTLRAKKSREQTQFPPLRWENEMPICAKMILSHIRRKGKGGDVCGQDETDDEDLQALCNGDSV